MATYDVIAYGFSDARRLVEGDILTGADVRTFVVGNDIVRVTYETAVPDSERGGCMLWRKDADGEYRRAFTRKNMDWSYFRTAITVVVDKITIVTATTDIVRAVLEWTAFTFLGGAFIPNTDHVASLNYASGMTDGNYKKITSVKLRKVIVLKRGREGYEVGWQTEPHVGPDSLRIPTDNNANDYGEREFGTGGENYLHLSSAGYAHVCQTFSANARGWVALGFADDGFTNRPAYTGHDDPSASPFDQPAVQALQHAGFPSEQTTGVCWMADLHNSNADDLEENPDAIPFVRYTRARERRESGCWHFGASALGASVWHYVHPHKDARGIYHDTMIFIGAFPYVSANLATEINDTTALRARIAARCPADWDLTGVAHAQGFAAHTRIIKERF